MEANWAELVAMGKTKAACGEEEQRGGARGSAAHRTPLLLATSVKAATARSMSAVLCAAEIWTRMRALPLGTTLTRDGEGSRE